MALGCNPPLPERSTETCKNVTVGDLVVTEFMADPAGSDPGKQYIEIYNTTDRRIDLTGLSLFQSLADGSRLNAIALRGARIPAQTYFVLGDTGNEVSARPAYVNYGYGSALGALRHESGRLGLRCGTVTVAAVTYAQVTVGRALELDGAKLPTEVLGNERSSWCDTTEPLNGLQPEGKNYGSPGTPNQACFKSEQGDADAGAPSENLPNSGGAPASPVDSGVFPGQCFDTQTGVLRSAKKPAYGDLFVSEIMPAPSIGNNGPGEWFELIATDDVDLNGLELANEATGSTVLISDSCLSVNSCEWLLIARGADPTQNGGLPSPLATFDFALADSSSSTYAERALILRIDGTELDRTTWTRSTKGASLQRSLCCSDSPIGTLVASWCVPPTDRTFGMGDRGTPGAANTICPSDVADAGVSDSNDASDAGLDNALGVADAGSRNPCRDANNATRDAVPPQIGDLVISEVMSAPSQGNNGPGEWFEVLVNADVDLNGLELANEGAGSTLLANASCLSVRVGQRLLFARDTDPALNGRLPPVTATFGFTLADSSSTTYAERAVVLRYAGSELSRTSWTKSTRGASWQLSSYALDAGVGGTAANAGSNLAQWCTTPNGVTYGSGDRGTPSAENTVCP